MEPIYTSPLVIFLERNTNMPVVHPKGDYQALNVAIRRLEKLVKNNQPDSPVIIRHSGEDRNPDTVFNSLPEKKAQPQKIEDIVQKNIIHEKFKGIFTLSESEPNRLATHSLMIPPLGGEHEMSTIFSTNTFYSDSKLHAAYLLGSVNSMIARMEKHYDGHPLQHQRRVQFRQAKYFENRQSFSFWDASKPDGDYPLSKPVFDDIISELDKTQENYAIYVDTVSDWGKQYSMFDGVPEFYAIELGLFIDNTLVALVCGDCSKTDMTQFAHDHDIADQFLHTLLEPLKAQLAGCYEAFVQNRAIEQEGKSKPKIH